MKRGLYTLVALMLLATGLVSCNSNTPKKKAEKFLNSFYHMDYKAAKEVSTDDTKKVLDMIEQFATMVPDSSKQNAKKIKIDVKDVKEVNDTTANVTYATSENKQDQQLTLVKKNGEWLVNWSKDTNGAGANDAQPAEEPTMTDTTASPADGTQSAPEADTAATKK